MGNVRNALTYPGRDFVLNATGQPKILKRGDMNTNAQIMMTLVLHNIRPRSHTSDIPFDIACMIYYILQEREIDVARIISNEIRAIASSGHHLGTKTPATLVFPGLIMGLCTEADVSISDMVHKTIKGVVNDFCIESHCMPRIDAPPP